MLLGSYSLKNTLQNWDDTVHWLKTTKEADVNINNRKSRGKTN